MASIILIGPNKAGKSTLRKLLSEQANLPGRSCYQMNLADFGYDEHRSSQIFTLHGTKAAHSYESQFYPELVKQLLQSSGDAVVELEADFVSYEDAELTARLEEILQPFPLVVLLLPSPDLEESVRILRQREVDGFDPGHDLNDFFVDHPSNKIFARKTFYNKAAPPEQTVNEIISALDIREAGPILLIGPMGAGKSTLGVLLGRKLGLSQVSLDTVRWKYYNEIGYDAAAASEKQREGGMFGLYNYWQPFHAHAVKRVLEDYPASVIDFGAGHSVYSDQELLEQVKTTLAPYKNIFLILPSADATETKSILRQRGERIFKSIFDLHEEFNRNGNFEKIAKQTIYTEGKTPEQVAREILELNSFV